jgi:hypothetical protein
LRSSTQSHSIRESGAIVREAEDPLCDDDLNEVDNKDFLMTIRISLKKLKRTKVLMSTFWIYV